jgi:hypothetical protein
MPDQNSMGLAYVVGELGALLASIRDGREVEPAPDNDNSALVQDTAVSPIRENYWSVVKTKLEQGGDEAWNHLELDCPICFRELNIGKPKPELDEGVDSRDIESYPHDVRIAVCGHIFCEDCVFRLCFTEQVEDCPICKGSWMHTNCYNVNEGRRFPRSKDDFIPRVISEGGSLAPKCAECSLINLGETVLTMSRLFVDHSTLNEDGEWFGIAFDTGRVVMKMTDAPRPDEGQGLSLGSRLHISEDFQNATEALMNGFRNTMKTGWTYFRNRSMHFQFFAFELHPLEGAPMGPRMFRTPLRYIGWSDPSDFYLRNEASAFWRAR